MLQLDVILIHMHGLLEKKLVSFSTAFESSKISDPRLKVSKMSTDSIFALEELVSFLVNKETNKLHDWFTDSLRS